MRSYIPYSSSLLCLGLSLLVIPKRKKTISKLSPSPETVNMGLLFLWMQGRDKDGKVPTEGKTITTLVNISKTSHPTESSSERRWQTELKIMERRKAGSKGTF